MSDKYNKMVQSVDKEVSLLVSKSVSSFIDTKVTMGPHELDIMSKGYATLTGTIRLATDEAKRLNKALKGFKKIRLPRKLKKRLKKEY